MSTAPKNSKRVRTLIKQSGLSIRQIAAKAGINKATVMRAKAANKWPSQARVRNGLRAVLLGEVHAA